MPKKFTLDTHLYLIGPRGSGKSSVGRLLAQALKAPFHDVDEAIRREQGRSIELIVQEHGWPAFRRLENEALARLAQLLEPSVVATGGGVVLSETNRRIMRRSGTIIYLQAPLDVLIKRVTSAVGADHRPALTALPLAQEMEQILRERELLYLETATATVNAALSEKEITAAILNIIAAPTQDTQS